MKALLCIVCGASLLAGTACQASEYQSGPYFGGQMGWGLADEGDGYKKAAETMLAVASKEIKRGEFTGWRAYTGYSIIPCFSVEVGYTHFPDNVYSSTSAGLQSMHIESKTYAIDFVGKIILPFGDTGFSVYGKGGGAYVRSKLDNANLLRTSNQTIRPTYGAGIAYNFSDNIAIDASWMGIYGKDRISLDDIKNNVLRHPVPHCNLFSLGISYKMTGIL